MPAAPSSASRLAGNEGIFRAVHANVARGRGTPNNRPMSPRVAIASVLLSACCAQTTPTTASLHGSKPPAPPPTPLVAAASPPRAVAPVTVAIVIDQFAAWVARDRLGALSQTGGFARLRREGTWVQDMRYAHAVTDTAPGHASLFSGKVPREHGIVANEVYKDGRVAAIVADDATREVSAVGEQPDISASARAIETQVVADRFKAQAPKARVYAFSLKDRGAIPGGGKHPDLSLWYEAKSGEFVSSTAFTHRLPDWVLPALGQEAQKQRLEHIWTLLRPIGDEMPPMTGDDQPGESDFAHYGVTFPHQPSHSTQPFAAFRADPESDQLLLELGLLALDNSPSDSPVLLAISLSANDYIGHLFGPDSWEAKDELARLDASLAWFFDELDRRRGPSGWSLVLSADHGIVPLPEVSRQAAGVAYEAGLSRPHELTERIFTGDLRIAANRAAASVAGKGDWVAAILDPYLYLSDGARRLASDKAAKLRTAVVDAVGKMPGVAKVFDISTLPASCPPLQDESLDALVCRSVHPGRGGDYYIALKPGCFFDSGYAPGTGTSHGNAELADRSVPLFVRAPTKVEAGKVETKPQSFEMFARQLERLLNL